MKGLKGVIKAGIKEALQSGQLNSWWWISQPLDLFVFCGSSLSPPSTTPLSPLTPLISPTLTIQSPNPSSPSCPCAPHTIPRLSPQPLSQAAPPTCAGTPGTWETDRDRRGHRTFGKTMEKREAAKQWWPATRVCHSCTRSTLQGVGRGNPVTRVSNGSGDV